MTTGGFSLSADYFLLSSFPTNTAEEALGNVLGTESKGIRFLALETHSRDNFLGTKAFSKGR